MISKYRTTSVIIFTLWMVVIGMQLLCINFKLDKIIELLQQLV